MYSHCWLSERVERFALLSVDATDAGVMMHLVFEKTICHVVLLRKTKAVKKTVLTRAETFLSIRSVTHKREFSIIIFIVL